jgi:hypothetical protein
MRNTPDIEDCQAGCKVSPAQWLEGSGRTAQGVVSRYEPLLSLLWERLRVVKQRVDPTLSRDLRRIR